ncbi:MAG: hypothetical protein ABIK31_03305 [candidate division WOR-3 bacterium]
MKRIVNWLDKGDGKSQGKKIDIMKLYKELQSLYSKEDLLVLKRESLESKIKEVLDKIEENKSLLVKNLTESVVVNGKSVIDIILLLRDRNLISFLEEEDVVYSYIYKQLKSCITNNKFNPGYIIMSGEVTEDGHLIICPDPDNCTLHKNKVLVKVGIDLSTELTDNLPDSRDNLGISESFKASDFSSTVRSDIESCLDNSSEKSVDNLQEVIKNEFSSVG